MSFDVEGIPVVNLYKFEEERYGASVNRFLSFKNDEAHKLGQTPIPDGGLTVYRFADDQKHLSYEGQSSFKYIPVNEEVELDLGAVADVVVEPNLIETRTDNYRFDNNRNIAGWDEIQVFAVHVRNAREVAVQVEITRNFGSPYWNLRRTGDVGRFEKVDVDTIKFTVELPPHAKKSFEYTLTTYNGVRTENWSEGSK
jgi:hypothetical protein